MKLLLGYVQTLFGFYQMCGGPIYGFIIKKFGIRNALYLCYGSTMLSGLLLYNSMVSTLIGVRLIKKFFIVESSIASRIF
uniref:MFS domain-containing protein n=1 Tax=Heterorhabditis bacteriophora TaxID=37862 RepID=A0A1I7WZ30_HETBA